MQCTTNDKLPTNAQTMHCCPMSGRNCMATWTVLVNPDEFLSTNQSQPPITFQWFKKIVWTLYVVSIFCHLCMLLWQQNCAWTELWLTSTANLSVIWMFHFLFCTCSQHFFTSHMLKVEYPWVSGIGLNLTIMFQRLWVHYSTVMCYDQSQTNMNYCSLACDLMQTV